MADEVAKIVTGLNIFEGYYANLFRTGDIMEADNPTDTIICRDILITVIFGCEASIWSESRTCPTPESGSGRKRLA